MLTELKALREKWETRHNASRVAMERLARHRNAHISHKYYLEGKYDTEIDIVDNLTALILKLEAENG